MKNILKLEELVKLIASYLVSLWFGFDWWLFPVLFLLPDLGMLGYLAGKRWGAITYNLCHHQGLALLLALAGYLLTNQVLLIAGIVLFGHSAFDRILGYGLKYPDSFQNTHLGRIGKEPAIAAETN